MLIGYGIHTVIGNEDPEKTDAKAAWQEEEEVFMSTETESEAKTETVSFETIDSILNYDIPEGIAERLNVSVFDEALKKYLEKEGLISTASGEESSGGLYQISCDGLLTEDVDHNVFYFDLVIDDGSRTRVTAAAGEDHEYTFSR